MSPRLVLLSGIALVGLCGIARSQEAAHDHSAHSTTAAPTEASEIQMPVVSDDASTREHVPPPAPSSTPALASHDSMSATMGMDDSAPYGLIRFDRAEYRQPEAFGWDADGWYGGDYDRLWLKTEGEREHGEWDGRHEALWSRVITRWWSSQFGLRRDFGGGASRTWVAAGVEGLAPYFFDIEATAYVSDQGHLSARFAASYDLLFTQRLVLQPDIELTAFNKAEPNRLRGSGLSNATIGLRLRYEVRREMAPYAGIEWSRSFGQTSDLLLANREPPSDLRWVAGLRFWF